MIFHCIYTSVQTRPLSAEEISRLVEHSRDSNARHDLTGVLLHVGSTFFQVLEGEQDTIDKLYARILSDSRHAHVTRIIFEPIAHRYFSDSHMSLTTLSPDELAEILDSHDPQEVEALLSGLDEGRAKKLLRAFSDGRWRMPHSVSPHLDASAVPA